VCVCVPLLSLSLLLLLVLLTSPPPHSIPELVNFHSSGAIAPLTRQLTAAYHSNASSREDLLDDQFNNNNNKPKAYKPSRGLRARVGSFDVGGRKIQPSQIDAKASNARWLRLGIPYAEVSKRVREKARREEKKGSKEKQRAVRLLVTDWLVLLDANHLCACSCVV
jgi:hypothetical protein